MNILCVGQAVYDITFPCESSIVENQKYRIYNRLECMGAPAANAAYLCALWGAETHLMARVGDDLFGKEIIRQLHHVGVKTDNMLIDPNHATSISCILANTSNGNRTILNSPMSEIKENTHFSQATVDAILMDGHELDASLSAMNQYPNALSILDAGTYKPEIIDLITSVDYLVCSQDFACQYSGITIDLSCKETITNTFKKLKELNQYTIVITLGEQGVVFEEDNCIYHIPAFKANAVDTTGAGDIFHGAFTFFITSHYSLHETIRLSSLTSSISIETLGGQTSIPKLEDVMNKDVYATPYELQLHF